MTAYSSRYKTWLLSLLMAVYACGFIDRIIVSVIGPAIAKDLHLSDLQFGLLGGMAFAVFYSAFGVPVARLADRRSRVSLIAWSVALWSAMTMLCGAAQTYWQLLLFRMGLGIGEAGGTPPAHSLISDHFPASRRASMLSIYSIGVPVGATAGAVAGGWLAQTFNWRVAFLVVGAPGLLLALLVKMTLREPPRGYAEGQMAPAAMPPFWSAMRQLLTRPTFAHICAGASMTALAANGIGLFAPTYFVRTFGMGMGEVGLIYGLVTGVTGITGILVGGFGADLGARRDVRWYGWVPAAGVALAAPLYILAYTQTAFLPAMALILAGGLCMSVYFAPTFAVVQNLVEPRMRASATALVLLSMNVVGQGIGPMIMGLASDAAARSAFLPGDYGLRCVAGRTTAEFLTACTAASAVGLRRAIIGAAVFFLWGSAHYLLAARTLHAKYDPA